jgi:two-component system sensor histidine kinase TctE
MNMSLRSRLILIILLPLLVIAGIIGFWAVQDAQSRAEDRFDRSLLSAVLAVSRDVAVSGGDALSPETNALLRDTSGGLVFYHVYAPDGVFVTGYATPPVSLEQRSADDTGQLYYDGVYQGQQVRVLKFVDATQIEGLSGDFTFTVWQNTRLRTAIVQDLSRKTFSVIASLVVSVALVVWFGVRFGLRPLNDLEAAIARRSSAELDPIKRRVPVETKGIVNTLNHLLAQMADTMRAKDEFISNAAHQLRNPIAGVASMSEAVHSAKSFTDAKERSAELVIASRKASDLAHKLLALERATSSGAAGLTQTFDLTALMADLTAQFDPIFERRDVRLTTDVASKEALITGDSTLISEAISNLLDNALQHGGPALSSVSLSQRIHKDMVEIIVADDGQSFDKKDIPKALERFGQVQMAQGSGLGLAIAQATTNRHGGQLKLSPSETGTRVTMTFQTIRKPNDKAK